MSVSGRFIDAQVQGTGPTGGGVGGAWKSLLPYIDQTRWANNDSNPAYFVHRGRVHMRGRMFWDLSSVLWETDLLADLIMIVPPDMRPSTPIAVPVPMDFANMTGNAPDFWPTVVHPDGRWEFTSYTWPGQPTMLPHFPDRRAWDSLGEGIMLAGASWVVDPTKTDSPTWVDLSPYLNTSYWQAVTAVEGSVHGNMAHFRGRVAVVQQMFGEFASRIFSSLPPTFDSAAAGSVGFSPVFRPDGYMYQGEMGYSLGGVLIDLDGYSMSTYEWVDTLPETPNRGFPASEAVAVAGTDGKAYVLPQPNLTNAADPFGIYNSRHVDVRLAFNTTGTGKRFAYWCIGDPTGSFYRLTATVYYPGNGELFDAHGGVRWSVERVVGGVATLLSQFADNGVGSLFGIDALPPNTIARVGKLSIDYDDYWVVSNTLETSPGQAKVSFWIANGSSRVVIWEPRPPGVSVRGPVGFAVGDALCHPEYIRVTDHPVRSIRGGSVDFSPPGFYPQIGQEVDLSGIFWLMPGVVRADPGVATVGGVAQGTAQMSRWLERVTGTKR